MGMCTQAWVKRSICVLFALMIAAMPAAAQSLESPQPLQSPQSPQPPQSPESPQPPQSPRPAALIPLYISFGALQVFDIHSTTKALAAGGREANPVFAVGGGSTLSVVLMKSAATAGVVFGTERLARKHPKIAVLLMVGLNSAQAAIVAHNYALSQAMR